MRANGMVLPETIRVVQNMKGKDFTGHMVVATPSAIGSPWMKKFKPASIGMASGWMALRGTRRRRSADRGFVLSDHADWVDLNKAIKATGADKVYVTHGYTEIFSRWLTEQGYEAYPVRTEFEGELGEIESS